MVRWAILIYDPSELVFMWPTWSSFISWLMESLTARISWLRSTCGSRGPPDLQIPFSIPYAEPITWSLALWLEYKDWETSLEIDVVLFFDNFLTFETKGLSSLNPHFTWVPMCSTPSSYFQSYILGFFCFLLFINEYFVDTGCVPYVYWFKLFCSIVYLKLSQTMLMHW